MIEMDICPSVEARGRPLVEVRDLTVTFALRSGAVRADLHDTRSEAAC